MKVFMTDFSPTCSQLLTLYIIALYILIGVPCKALELEPTLWFINNGKTFHFCIEFKICFIINTNKMFKWYNLHKVFEINIVLSNKDIF